MRNRQGGQRVGGGLLLLLALASSWQAGCGRGGSDGKASGAVLRAVCTTGMVADLVRHVGGRRVRVTALMGPGVDPHLYKASAGDVALLSEADVIFYNGLHLEGKMGDVLVKMSRSRPVVRVTESIPPELLREPPEFQGQYDPHVWFDVALWARCVDRVRDALVELDPEGRPVYEANAAAYRSRLEALDRWVRERVASIPKERRVLVTAHDAFGYFGRAYGVEVVGLQGISTAAEYGLQDIRRIVELLVSRRIPAVFVETSVSPRAIEAVIEGCRARGFEVRIGGRLFSDAMGEEGTPEGTYVGMVRHNVNAIVEALQ